MDAVQPKAVKKKFDDRKDKDIDNDGDVDSSDKFLHKKRKAISKSINKEEVELDEDTVILDLEDDDKKLMSNIKRMGIKVKKVSNEQGDGYAEYSLTGSKSNLEKANKKLKLVDDDIMAFKESALIEGYSKEIKMAIGIASDKRYAGGNMTGAVKAIEKIKKVYLTINKLLQFLKDKTNHLLKRLQDILRLCGKIAEAKEGKVKEDEESPKKKEAKSAMTGKPMAGVEVNPKESKAK